MCACARVSWVRGRGAGRLAGRWCHFINSGAQVLRSSSRFPPLSFAGDPRRASASEPLREPRCRRASLAEFQPPSLALPRFRTWSPFILPYLFFGISFFFPFFSYLLLTDFFFF